MVNAILNRSTVVTALAFLLVATVPLAGKAHANLTIDTLESTESGNTEFLSDPPGTPAGAPNMLSETNLTGVVGGASTVRKTSVSSGGPGTVTAAIVPSQNRIAYSSGGATGQLSINYSAPGGLNAGFAPFLGMSIPLSDIELTGAMTPIPVSIKLTDGNGMMAVGMGQITTENDQTLFIPAASFANLNMLDLSDIDVIEYMFMTSPGQEFDIDGPLLEIMVPEPATVLAWLVVGACLAFGWKRYGHRLRVRG